LSVPVGKRSEGELVVNTKARKLAVYTLKILENDKYFPRSQSVFIAKIQNCVIEIVSLCWEANNIKVGNNEDRYAERIRMQDRAASLCNRLCVLIEISKPLFHLESRRVRYWINLTVEVRNKIRAWRDNDARRLKPNMA